MGLFMARQVSRLGSDSALMHRIWSPCPRMMLPTRFEPVDFLVRALFDLLPEALPRDRCFCEGLNPSFLANTQDL